MTAVATESVPSVPRIPAGVLVLPDEPADVVEVLREQHAEAGRRLEELDASYQERRGALLEHRALLERLLDDADAKWRGRRHRPRKGADLDPHAQAGHDNVARLEEVFRLRGTITQADGAREARVRSGSATWAIRALLADGKIEETGRKFGVTREFRYVEEADRVTTLGPGEGPD